VLDGRRDSPSYRENATGFYLEAENMRWYWDQYAPDEASRTAPDASVVHAPDLAGLPPALVVSAEFDPLRDEADAYAARLEAAGVPTRTRRYVAYHGFLSFPEHVEAYRAALAEVCAEIRALAGLPA